MRTRSRGHLRQVVFLSVLLITGGRTHIAGAWPVDGAGICAGPSDHARVGTVSDGLGGVFVVWTDKRTGFQDLYALRIDDSGQPAPGWPACGIRVCSAAGNQNGLAVPDRQGGVVIVWNDSRTSPKKVYAQRLDASGNLQWNVQGVRACDADSLQLLAAAIPDGQGGVIALWMDTRRATPPLPPHYHLNFDLFAQRIDASGARAWDTAGVPVCADSGDRSALGTTCMDSDGKGGAVLVFGEGNYYAQRLDISGIRRWGSDGTVIPGGGYACAVADSGGGMWVVNSDGRDGLYHVWAEHVDSSGVVLSPPGGLLINSGGPDEAIDDRFPSAVPDGAGGIITTWSDTRTHIDRDIYAQHVLAAGSVDPSWPSNGLPVCVTPGVQINPTLVGDDSSGAIIAWYDVRDTTTSYDIYAQHVTGKGKISPGWQVNGVRLCGAANNQVYPDLVTDGLGGAIASWDDYRTVYQNTYAQRVSSIGNVGTVATAAEGGAQAFFLDAPRPNPASDELLISFSLDGKAPARVALFDVKGRAVRSTSLGSIGPGRHLIRVPIAGSLSPGVYLVRLTEGSHSVSRMVAVVR